MKLPLRRLLQEHRGPVKGSETFPLEGRDFHQYHLAAPAQLVYEATPEGGSVKLAFTLTAEVAADCARCLSPMRQTQRIEKEYRITAEELAEEYPELPIGPDGALDLEELSYQELVLETPPILLCREDCEGLCAQCGKPAGTCGCTEEREVDPRLQSLLQLLED